MSLHAELSPIPCQVAASFLYRDTTRTDYEQGEIIGLSSYPGSVPTFKVLLTNGALFSYVPPTALCSAAVVTENKVGVDQNTFTFKTCKDELEPIYDTFADFLKKKSPGFYAFGLSDLCYNDCPSEKMTVTVFNRLTMYPVVAYMKACKLFISGIYRVTLDWSDANILLHLIELENGQFAFLPSHKVLFDNNPKRLKSLPRYRAIHNTFSVSE